jgi:hypothetical protein
VPASRRPSRAICAHHVGLRGVGYGVGIWVLVGLIPLLILTLGTKLPAWVGLVSLVVLVNLVEIGIAHAVRQRCHREETISFVVPFPL